MNASTVMKGTVDLSKKAGHSVVNIAGKAKDYASGMGSLVVKDVKKVPGFLKKMPSALSRAVRSKIEINIIMPEQKKAEQPTQDQDAEVIES